MANKKPIFRNSSNYLVDTGKIIVSSLECNEDVITCQSSKFECDINNLMMKYTENGTVEQYQNGFYDDVSDLNLQYHEALNLINTVKDDFSNLSSNIRDKFASNPFELISFLENKENLDEAIELGLVKKPENWIAPKDRERYKQPVPSTPTPAQTPAQTPEV